MDGDVGADVRVRRAPGVALDALSRGVHRAQVRRRQRRAHRIDPEVDPLRRYFGIVSRFFFTSTLVHRLGADGL